MVPPGVVLLANLVAGLLLVVVARGVWLKRGLPRQVAALALVPLVVTGLLTAYVFGEDSYRGNGISRWDAYTSPGGALGPMFVLSVALMSAGAGLLAFAGLRGHERLLRATAVTTGLTALFLVIPTTIAFNLN